MIVAIDMDDVIWDFVSPLLNSYNLRYNDNVRKEDITNWNIHNFLKPECTNIFKEFVTPEFINDLEISKTVCDIIETLNNLCELHFLTASHSKILYYKAEKIKSCMPFIQESQINKVTDKSLFKCDILIDDNAENIRECNGKGILVAQPWNIFEDNVERLSPVRALLKALLDVSISERGGYFS